MIETNDTVRLTAANGTSIPTYGRRTLPLRFGRCNFSWEFILADVRRPLLGADFLAHNSLLVDVRGQKLLDSRSFRSLPLRTCPQSERSLFSTFVGEGLSSLLTDFPEVFRPELRQNPGTAAKHGIYHFITTHGRPVYQRFRRLAPDRLTAAKAHFAEMERMGICSKASSPWASPLHIVPKPDGTLRPCGDYRLLNLQTEPDRYPMPNIADLIGSLHGAKIFSKLDLLKGYFQVPVNPEDVPKTAIITPFGSYVFHYSTFGLRNSGATFQRLMDSIFGDLPCVVVYADDILVFSNEPRQHRTHLRSVLQLLSDNGLICRPDKCVLGASSVEFLGHLISAEGAQPLPSKVQAIEKFPTPSTIKDLQEFIGLINYYHRFVPSAAKHLVPLYEVLRGKPKNLIWAKEQKEAFALAKAIVAKSTSLAYPIPGAPTELVTDASDLAIGAVLQQTVGGMSRPLGFFSRKLKTSEKKYSTFDKELLAIFMAIRHFRHILDGCQFVIRTDHKPIVYALTKNSDAWSSRQQRQLSAISEMSCTVEHLSGDHNVVADALSRIEIGSVGAVVPGIDYHEMAEIQRSDPETQAYRTSITGLKWCEVPWDNSTLLCDVSTGRPRPLVPEQLRRRVFQVLHSLSHPSSRSTVKLITSKFIWHGAKKDITNWSRLCVACQGAKVSRHTKSGVGTFKQPHRRFGHIHVDVVGPLPSSNGSKYLFTTIDRSTRWPEAIPMTEATAQSCARALLHGWISHFGLPEIITSDRGSTFTSDLWKCLSTLLGVKLCHTTAYNPGANGLVERSHRTLKQALMARLCGPDWTSHLPWVMLGLRTVPKEGLGVSAAEMTYGEPLVVPGEFFPAGDRDQESRDHLQKLRAVVKEFTPHVPSKTQDKQLFVPAALKTAKFVFVRDDAHRRPLTPPYRGPYKVLEREPKALRLDINGRSDWVSIDRTKPAYLEAEDLHLPCISRYGRTSRPPKRFRP